MFLEINFTRCQGEVFHYQNFFSNNSVHMSNQELFLLDNSFSHMMSRLGVKYRHALKSINHK